jgi:hypothetical protein
VICGVEFFPGNGQAKLEKHIESGRDEWRISIQSDSGQIMNRVATPLDFRKDFVQSSCPIG